jgi:ABC-2 type transport system ATP-binding protein
VTPVLELVDVSKRYGDLDAVASLSFAISPGEELALVGPNGSGKSTTLHMIVGLLEPSSGVIELAGRPASDLLARRAVGFVPDDLPMPTALTGAEYLQLNRSLRRLGDSTLESELVEVLDLSRHLGRLVAEYSHGMKRKLQLVAAAAQIPELLILDEPHRGLDPEAGAVMRMLLDSLKARGVALLVATHDLHAAATDGDHVLVLSRGRNVGLGTPSELCDLAMAGSFSEAFLRLSGLEAQTAAAAGRLENALDAAGLARR